MSEPGCARAAEMIALEACGELGAEDARRLAGHLEACDRCRALRERTRETSQLLSDAVAWAGPAEGSGATREGVLSRLDLPSDLVADADGEVVPAAAPVSRSPSASRLPAARGTHAVPVVFVGRRASRLRSVVLAAAAALALIAAGAAFHIWRTGGNPLTVTGGQLVAEGEPVSGELRRGGRVYRVTGDGPAVLRCGDSAALRLMPGTVFQAGVRSISGQSSDLSVNEGALYVHMAPGARLALETARASVSAKGDFYLRVSPRESGIAGAAGLFAVHAAEAEEAMPAGPPAELLLVGFSGTVELKLPGGKTDRIGKNEVFVVSRDLPRERWEVDELIQHLRGEAQRLSWPKQGTPEWQELDTYRKVVETYLLDSAQLTAVSATLACDPQAAAPARDRLQRICRHLSDHLPKFGELKAKYGGRGQDPARSRRMGELLDHIAGAHQGFADAGWWQEALRKEE